MGLPCHDGEVEGVVVEDDAVLASFFPFCFLHFPSLVSANTPSLKANPQLCISFGDAVLVLGIRGCARYAQAHIPKRRSYHRVPRVPQGWLLRHEELVGLLGSAVDFFQEIYHRLHRLT